MPSPKYYPLKPTAGPLHKLWNARVRDLVSLPVPTITPEAGERHSLYSLLVLALIAVYWNGNKKGPDGKYPWRRKQKSPDGHGYAGGDYVGHNIACIGVDGFGRVIDFDFNHNYVFDSTVEHAESRLVRRIFGLVHLHDGWMLRDPSTPLPLKPTATFLNDVSIYTSLEACSQCAGMMVLGNAKEVIFLQSDPGQFSIGNVLRNLNKLAPLPNGFIPLDPIPADLFGFKYFKQLNDGYAAFEAGVKTKAFHISADGLKKDFGNSISSYLCTDHVFKIVNEAAKNLGAMTSTSLKFPHFKPAKPPVTNPVVSTEPPTVPLTNAEVLLHVKKFWAYAKAWGRRGTPHRV
jgi:tRNA(Arg) A34 adenosine deaminase TadA